MSETTRRINSRDRILNALQVAGSLGVTNLELAPIALRYGGRIHELRALGHEIESIHEGEGVWRFILKPKTGAVQLPLIEGLCCHAQGGAR